MSCLILISANPIMQSWISHKHKCQDRQTYLFDKTPGLHIFNKLDLNLNINRKLQQGYKIGNLNPQMQIISVVVTIVFVFIDITGVRHFCIMIKQYSQPLFTRESLKSSDNYWPVARGPYSLGSYTAPCDNDLWIIWLQGLSQQDPGMSLPARTPSQKCGGSIRHLGVLGGKDINGYSMACDVV